MERILSILFLCLIATDKISAQNTQLQIKDICAGTSDGIIDCSKKTSDVKENAVILTESIYGVLPDGASECKFTTTDCHESVTTSLQCTGLKETCLIRDPRSYTTKCNKKTASYNHLRYYCIPTSFTSEDNTYNILNTREINGNGNAYTKGILKSPEYPKFVKQTELLVTKITAPAGKTLNIWVTDLNIQVRSIFDKKCIDFLRITDSTGEYELCGAEKTNLVNTLCSNTVYISYKAGTSFASLKGFMLYYEFIDAPKGVTCNEVTPVMPTTMITGQTLSTRSTNRPPLDIAASQSIDVQICKGQTLTVDAGEFYVLYIESILKGASNSPFCEDYNEFSHCTVDEPIPGCHLRQTCVFSLIFDEPIFDCSDAIAQYIYVRYKKIPIDSRVKLSVCSTDTFTVTTNGIVVSNLNPVFETNRNCQLVLTASSVDEIFDIYVTEIFLEGQQGSCTTSYLQLDDGVSSRRYCGQIIDDVEYLYTSSTNKVTITYVTSNSLDLPYSGFKLYYEKHPKTRTTIPPRPTLSPVSGGDLTSSVLTTEGEPCTFPFIYNGRSYSSCTQQDRNEYWCSTTSNYDVDRKSGTCSKGFTEISRLKVCNNEKRKFTCPKGYLIKIYSEIGAVTSDGSCLDSRVVCTGPAASVDNNCAGKLDCTIAGGTSVPSCSIFESNFISVVYSCIPDDVAYIPVPPKVCNGDFTITEDYGFLPSIATFNTRCSVTIQPIQNKFIDIYAVRVRLPNECQNRGYLQIGNDDRICGVVTSRLIAQKCMNDPIEVAVFTDTVNLAEAKLFYEVRDVGGSDICNPQTFTTNTMVTNPPDYAVNGIASPTTMEYTFCRSAPYDFIGCPADYILIVSQAFYGRSDHNSCFFSKTDCLRTKEVKELNCNGKNTCKLPPYNQFLVECNDAATYLRVQYDCIPGVQKIPPQTMCGNTYNARNLILQSNDINQYPPSTCESTISVDSKYTIKLFIIDLYADSDAQNCALGSFTIKEDGGDVKEFCGTQSGFLAYESCTNKLTVNFKTQNPGTLAPNGVTFYYETVVKPFGFQCTNPAFSTQAQTTYTGTTIPATTTLPTYYGFSSNFISRVRCFKSKLSCPVNYVIIIRTSRYGVKDRPEEGCVISPTDCYGQTDQYNYCSGRNECDYNFDRNVTVVPECQDRKANYILIEYQCVPTANAGRPAQANIDICNVYNNQLSLASDNAVIVQSPSHPSYINKATQCTITITSPQSGVLVYLTAVSFPGDSNCDVSQDYVKLSDGFQTRSFCGNRGTPNFVFETSSNSLQITFSAKDIPRQIQSYKGFQLFIESTTDLKSTRNPGVTPLQTIAPFTLGFMSALTELAICDSDRREITCPSDYMIIVSNELAITAKQGCYSKNWECFDPSDLVTNECGGKQTCNFYFSRYPMSYCAKNYADQLDIRYRCVPSGPNPIIPTFSCNDRIIKTDKNGFIQSPSYPKYEFGVYDCKITIQAPEKKGITLYLIDLALSSNDINDQDVCDDYLVIDNRLYCQSLTPRFITNSRSDIELQYRSLANQVGNENANEIKGFKLYFEFYDLSSGGGQTTTPQPTTRKPKINFIVVENNSSSVLIGVTLGLGIPIIIILVGIIYYLGKKNGSNSTPYMSRISFSKKDHLNEDISSFSNPSFDN